MRGRAEVVATLPLTQSDQEWLLRDSPLGGAPRTTAVPSTESAARSSAPEKRFPCTAILPGREHRNRPTTWVLRAGGGWAASVANRRLNFSVIEPQLWFRRTCKPAILAGGLAGERPHRLPPFPCSGPRPGGPMLRSPERHVTVTYSRPSSRLAQNPDCVDQR